MELTQKQFTQPTDTEDNRLDELVDDLINQSE